MFRADASGGSLNLISLPSHPKHHFTIHASSLPTVIRLLQSPSSVLACGMDDEYDPGASLAACLSSLAPERSPLPPIHIPDAAYAMHRAGIVSFHAFLARITPLSTSSADTAPSTLQVGPRHTLQVLLELVCVFSTLDLNCLPSTGHDSVDSILQRMAVQVQAAVQVEPPPAVQVHHVLEEHAAVDLYFNCHRLVLRAVHPILFKFYTPHAVLEPHLPRPELRELEPYIASILRASDAVQVAHALLYAVQLASLLRLEPAPEPEPERMPRCSSAYSDSGSDEDSGVEVEQHGPRIAACLTSACASRHDLNSLLTQLQVVRVTGVLSPSDLGVSPALCATLKSVIAHAMATSTPSPTRRDRRTGSSSRPLPSRWASVFPSSPALYRPVAACASQLQLAAIEGVAPSSCACVTGEAATHAQQEVRAWMRRMASHGDADTTAAVRARMAALARSSSEDGDEALADFVRRVREVHDPDVCACARVYDAVWLNAVLRQ